jgi:hypothetical protein
MTTAQPQRRPRQEWAEITIRVPPDLHGAIKAIAQREARTVSGLMRFLAMQHAEEERERERERERQQVTAA